MRQTNKDRIELVKVDFIDQFDRLDVLNIEYEDERGGVRTTIGFTQQRDSGRIEIMERS